MSALVSISTGPRHALSANLSSVQKSVYIAGVRLRGTINFQDVHPYEVPDSTGNGDGGRFGV